MPGLFEEVANRRYLDHGCRRPAAVSASHAPAGEATGVEAAAVAHAAVRPDVPTPGVRPTAVVHGAAEHLSDRREPDRPDRGELLHGQRGREGTGLAGVAALPLLVDAPLRLQRQATAGDLLRAGRGDLVGGPLRRRGDEPRAASGVGRAHSVVSRCRTAAADALESATAANSPAMARDHSSTVTVLLDITTPPDACLIVAVSGLPNSGRARSYRRSPSWIVTDNTAGSPRPARRARSLPSRSTVTISPGSAADSTFRRKPAYIDRSSLCLRNWAASISRSKYDEGGVPSVIAGCVLPGVAASASEHSRQVSP